MTNKELIKALRNHRVCDEDKCETCELMDDAADALEAAEKRIAELERILKAVQKNSGINFRLWQEAEAQMPKEGEWIYTPLERYKEYKVKCPFCGAEYHDCYDGYIDAEDFNYCPNCGARMDGEDDAEK